MKTLIELHDERPLDNVLGTEMFRPEETIFICQPEVAEDRVYRAALEKYFRVRHCPVKLTFVPVSLLDATQVADTLKRVLETREDCAIDISGGTDATLFAAGSVAGETPVFTYSRKSNRFYNIKNAPFADNLPCTIRLNAEACFLMAGGTLLPGREDNAKLKTMLNWIDRLFDVYTDYRRIWNRQVSYFQRISDADDEALRADGPRTAKADNTRVTADRNLLRALEKAGLISDLSVTEERVSFRFRDEVVRFWLRDMGSALELQVFRACLAANCFDDVVLSAVATSIDALSVGVSQSMLETMRSFSSIYPLAVTLFCVTVAVVLAGLLGGRLIGQRVGHWAEIAGGLVLIGIGVSFLF